jgi:hypothetical protein
MDIDSRLPVDRSRVRRFCRRWKITELALFGSILRQDFRDDSDIDVLVTFAPDAGWSLLDHAAMSEELEQLLGRKVDLVSRRAIESSSNWIRRIELGILEDFLPVSAGEHVRKASRRGTMSIQSCIGSPIFIPECQ